MTVIKEKKISSAFEQKNFIQMPNSTSDPFTEEKSGSETGPEDEKCNGFDKSHPIVRYFENLLAKKMAKKAARKGKKSFLVFKNGKYVTIRTKQIAYFFIQNETSTIMTFEKQTYPLAFSLDEVNKLMACHKFYRINRQYLISFAAIKEVEHYFSRKLLVKLSFSTQEELLICKEKAPAFLNWMENR